MILLLVLILAGSPTSLTEQQQRRIAGLQMSSAIPGDPTNRIWDNEQAAVLGQRVFFDPGFSRNGEVSCATCHDPALGFADGKPLPMGLAQGERHAPSLLNVAGHRWFFWDGRADTLWAQALHPFEREEEFGSSRLEVLHRIHSDPLLRSQYEQVFGSMPQLDDINRFPPRARPGRNTQATEVVAWNAMAEEDQEAVNIAFANLGKAIAAYEHQLITPPSDFDRFVDAMLAGNQKGMTVLSPAAQRGMLLFVGEAGCRQCHNGPLLSDLEFHNTGIPNADGSMPSDPGRWKGIQLLGENPFRANGAYSDAPESRRGQSTASLARNSEHWGAFRTPSLRNLNQTAPYMHQGQFSTLGEVLDFYNTLEGMVVMDHHQETVLAPLGLTSGQLADLEAFLLSLSSPPPNASLMAPLPLEDPHSP
ncbi:MAG: cytochrome c peroxidase [Phycisphaerales bacterium]|nr:cytochrome c peroxidase [Phycisphaerales bacterium]